MKGGGTLKSELAVPHARKGTSVPWLFILLSLCLIYLTQLSTVSYAADVMGESRTYVQSRQTLDGRNMMPFYEYLNLNVQDLGNESVSVHLGGWLGLQTDATPDGKTSANDLQYGYVSYRAKESNAVVNLGRVMVFEGVANDRVDGIYARTDIKGGFGISAYGGAPVEIAADQPGNSTIYGGRLSHQNPGLYTVGLSYLKEEKNSATFRQEEGIDLWFRPVNKVELMGSSSYNVETTGWMEHAYYLLLGPFDKLRFNTEASWINYADYFAGATTNVFRMTAGGPIDPHEKVNILGEEIFYAIDKNWAVSVNYKNYNYDIAGSANYYGVKATYVMPKSYNAGLSVHKMDGDTNRLKYDEYRIYASKRIEKVDVAVDLLDVKYKEAINNVTNAYSATIAAGYELTRSVTVGLDIEYSKNPDFDKDVRIFAKAVYSFDFASGSPKPAAGQEKYRAVSAPAAHDTVSPEQLVLAAPVKQGKPKEGN
jgi:hypothetical protein